MVCDDWCLTLDDAWVISGGTNGWELSIVGIFLSMIWVGWIGSETDGSGTLQMGELDSDLLCKSLKYSWSCVENGLLIW